MKQNISANALFHFTNSYERLISILSNNFSPRYCTENMSIIVDDYNEYSYNEVAIPMVCFCDITLSQIANHTAVYGSYGIGLTKEWGIKNGLNPILYSLKDSIATVNFKAIKNYSSDMKKNKKLNPDSLVGKVTVNINNFSRFIKPYEGIGKNNKKVTYYNEREWRYITSVENLRDINLPTALFGFNFETKKKFEYDLKKKNEKLSNSDHLEFSPEDIKYIIVEEETDIIRIFQDLRRIKGEKYSYNDVTKLTTRIMTHNQILEDF